MGITLERPCANCERLQASLVALQTELEAARGEIQCLNERLAAAKKDSSTSSKPPSSDIVKPTPPVDNDNTARTIGGQPGHPKHQRQPFPPEQVNHAVVHTLDACPDCAGPLSQLPDAPRVVQQIEILKPPLSIEQHTCPAYRCERCQRNYKAPMPTHIANGGLLGPQLTALIAFMKGVCHASFSTIRIFLRDVVGVTVSRSHLSDTLKKVSAALDGPYEELLQALPNEKILNVDETGHKDNGQRWWTWCFRADLYTLFHIDPHRSGDVLLEVLGTEFDGVLGCDYFSAYRRYMKECDVTVQFCLAHLIRDVKFLITLPDQRDRQYGEELRAALKELFAIFHQREVLGKEVFASKLEQARDRVLKVGLKAPDTRHSQNLARRFAKHGSAYFTFVTTPGVEPTNNLAEQAIRFVVIDRQITQGTRSEGGRRFCERIWTVIATCVGQGKSVYGYLSVALGQWFIGGVVPSLLS